MCNLFPSDIMFLSLYFFCFFAAGKEENSAQEFELQHFLMRCHMKLALWFSFVWVAVKPRFLQPVLSDHGVIFTELTLV